MSAAWPRHAFALAAGTLWALSLGTPEPVVADDLMTVSLGGGLALLSRQWTSRASFSNWAGWTDSVEAAQLEASHHAGSGPAYAVGLGFRISRRVGLSITTVNSWRDTSAGIQLSLPHPFLLARPRSVQGEAMGLSYRETAVHADADWRPVLGRFELGLFAGPSLVQVETDAIDSARVRDEYPYDAPSFQTSHGVAVRSDFTLGWNAGAAVVWTARRAIALGLEARYTSVKPDLRPSGVLPFQLRAGGLALTAMVRLRVF